MNKLSIILISALLLACSSSTDSSGGGIIGDRIEAPLFTLNTWDNNSYSLSQFEGKVVYLFFLGHNCSLCIGNAPSTKRIYEKYSSDDVQVLGLDVWNGTNGQVATFITQTGVQYPVLTKASSVGNSYDVGRDHSILVDKEGRIAYDKSGVSRASIEEVIDELLAE